MSSANNKDKQCPLTAVGGLAEIMATLSKDTAFDIIEIIDTATADPVRDIPGLVLYAINRNGEIILSHASGLRTNTDPLTPMTLGTIFWLASMTKVVTSIAVMQLYEQGKVDLDSTSQIEEVLPELAKVKVLTGFDDSGNPTYQKPKNKITMRMLLTHTSGFGYDMFHESLAKFEKYCAGKPEFSGHRRWLDCPVLLEPGTGFKYGAGIDWAGIFIERVSKLKLDTYFKRNILEPLGLNDISFYLSTEMRRNLVGLHARGPTGDISPIPHFLEAVHKGPDEEFPNLGGAILSVFLNAGVSPKTNARILKAETVDYMFQNHISHLPPDAMKPMDHVMPMPEMSNPMPSWSIYPKSPGWGLSFMLTPDAMPNGRGGYTAEWYGMVNLAFWCDRENGIAV
ncbi:hypothetical protein FGG08_000516 [Glutinoglossum americanum]|uniref:Beta-lactamase-related domain-containing protein n=1 Tax=Glutinoglossum americanum TaxID=1670608 RepID=A0A9P8ID02_9PEZI|nr:hypothetical protein FGG08_000516 [Glutinoglossum americanum]